MNENQGGTAAPSGAVDNSPTLTSVLGEMYGDYSDAEPETDAGAPPAATPEPPADSEGTAASEPTGEPPVVAEPGSEPDPSTPEIPTDDDLFDGSTPLPYTVNGESRSFDGITVLKSGGGIIEPSAMEKVARVFGERDHLFEQNKTQYEKYSTLERATAWHTKDADGKEQTLTGVPAAEAWRLHATQMSARNYVYSTAIDGMLKDPSNFAKLYDIFTDEQGQYGPAGTQYVVPSQKGFADLKREAENFARETTLSMREQFPKVIAAPPPPETPASDLAAPTIDAIAKEHAITGLSAEDKQFLAGQFERYVLTTKEGRMVDPRFVDLIKRTAQTASSAAAAVTSATTAAQANAKKLAAASIGKGGKQVAKIVTKAEPERTRSDDYDDAWDLQQKGAAAALRAHATR